LIACEAALQDRLGDTASAHRSQAYYLDVTPAGATKGHAVTRIAARLGLPLSAVAVIGDMSNDLPMFAVAGLAIAMGNATDAVKSAARFTTETNESEGFAVAMERFILPRA
jgi:hydroxymethylpyrimidine pyrophosphatase-like HAD family hydrolase